MIKWCHDLKIAYGVKGISAYWVFEGLFIPLWTHDSNQSLTHTILILILTKKGKWYIWAYYIVVQDRHPFTQIRSKYIYFYTMVKHIIYSTILRTYVAPVSLNAPVSVNVDNNGRYRSRYCKRVYNNGTVSVIVDSNGCDLSHYCQRLH